MRTEEEFVNLITQQINLSSNRRPHALTFDGLTAFEMGPVAISDITQGHRIKPWGIRVVGNDVYLTKSNSNNTAWEEETLLFSTTEQGSEFDLAFDQNGSVLVIWSQSGSIMLYGYDNTLYQYTIRELGVGRTPRISLDTFVSYMLYVSDVIIFYINDIDDRVDYRLQRDRYEVVYETDITGVSNMYLEIVTPFLNNRLYLWFTEYIQSEDKYIVHYWHSGLHPLYIEDSITSSSDSILDDGELRITIFELNIDDENLYNSQDIIDECIIRDTMRTIALAHDSDIASLESIINIGTIRDTIIVISVTNDSDIASLESIINIGTIRISTFERTMDDINISFLGDSILSGTKT